MTGWSATCPGRSSTTPAGACGTRPTTGPDSTDGPGAPDRLTGPDDVLDEPARRRHRVLRAGVDAATWALVSASTCRLAEHSTEALRLRAVAQQVAQRYRDVGLAQRAGHPFEVMHEASSNQDATAERAPVQAATTERSTAGSQNGAADLHIVSGGGRRTCRGALRLAARTVTPTPVLRALAGALVAQTGATFQPAPGRRAHRHHRRRSQRGPGRGSRAAERGRPVLLRSTAVRDGRGAPRADGRTAGAERRPGR